MSHDSHCNDNAVELRQRRRGGESCRSVTCVTPWHFVSRLFNGYKSKISRNKKERKWEKVKKIWILDARRKCGMVKESMKQEASTPFVAENLDVPAKENCYGTTSERKRSEESMRMDLLEAELQAEFDIFQLPMDNAELYDYYSDEQHSVVNVDEDSAPEGSQGPNNEEVITDMPDETYTVPPIELERRLHELLQSRQQERIEELESALECAIYELDAKERELSWWKETARFVSHHISNIPTLSSMMNVGEPVFGSRRRTLG